MRFSETDSDLEDSFKKLKNVEIDCNKKLQKIRDYQMKINNLKLIEKQTIQEINGVNQIITSFVIPNDASGTIYENEDRIIHKTSLIQNIDDFFNK